ncbi:hypothetical protein D3C86_1629220 [compost metagenome]
MVDVDKGQIIHLLQQHVAGIVENRAARMVIDQREKALKRHAVVQIFPRMQLKTEIHAVLIKAIQNRPPAIRQLAKRLAKTLLVVRWPRVDKRPGQRA